MATGAKYGFKFTGATIPDGTTSINAVISDGTTPTEYTLTGSVADGFSGTGASLSMPVIKLDDDAAVIIADSVYEINAEVSAWFDNLTFEELKRNDIYVNGNRLPYSEKEGVYLYIEDGIDYVVIPPREEGQLATFQTFNETTEQVVPGTYHLVIYDGSSAFNLTIDALTVDDVGDSYNVNVYTTEVTQSFKTAVEMVLEESGGGNKGIMQVNMTSDELGGVTCDKTFDEVLAALKNGTFVSVSATALVPGEGIVVTCECFSQDQSYTSPSKLTFGGVHVETSYPGSLYGIVATIDPKAEYNGISVFKFGADK